MGCKKMPSKSKPDFVSHTNIQMTVCSNLVNALMKHSQAGDSLLSASTKQPICNNINKNNNSDDDNNDSNNTASQLMMS